MTVRLKPDSAHIAMMKVCRPDLIEKRSSMKSKITIIIIIIIKENDCFF